MRQGKHTLTASWSATIAANYQCEHTVGGQPGRSGPPGNQNARKLGHRRVEFELKELRHRAISGRSWLGRTMRDWRNELLADLAGDLSTRELALVDVARRTKIMLDAVDVWLLQQPRLVTNRKGLHPAVVQRNGLVATLRSLLSDLGLRRRARQFDLDADDSAAPDSNGEGDAA